MAATYRIEQPDGSVYQVEMPENQISTAAQTIGSVPLGPGPSPSINNLPAFAGHFINAAGGGIPTQLARNFQPIAQMAQDQPQEFQKYGVPGQIGLGMANVGKQLFLNSGQGIQSQIANALASLAGYGVGLPGAVYQGAESAISQAIPALTQTMVGRAAQRGVVGALGGMATDIAQPSQYGQNATVGATANVILPPVISKALGMFHRTPPGKLINDAQFEELAGKVRQAIGGGKLAAGIDFDQGITASVDAKPDVATPISDFIDTIKTEMKVNSTYAEKLQQGMYRSAKQGNTTLQAMLGDESRAASATGRDLQNIKQTMQSVPSIDRALQKTYAMSANPKVAGRFDASVSDADLTLIDHISDLRGRLLSAYPELQNDYATYSQFMNDYRTISPQLRTSSIESALLGKHAYGNRLQRQAAGRILPSEILQEVEQVRTNQQQALSQIAKTKEFHKLLKKLGVWGALGAAAGTGGVMARSVAHHVLNE